MKDEAIIIRMLQKFYDVSSLEELVLAQDKHIEKLQEKLMRSPTWLDNRFINVCVK